MFVPHFSCFFSISRFSCGKHEKSIFWPAFGVHSTQILVKMCNRWYFIHILRYLNGKWEKRILWKSFYFACCLDALGVSRSELFCQFYWQSKIKYRQNCKYWLNYWCSKKRRRVTLNKFVYRPGLCRRPNREVNVDMVKQKEQKKYSLWKLSVFTRRRKL